jgi:hypothetical protein
MAFSGVRTSIVASLTPWCELAACTVATSAPVLAGRTNWTTENAAPVSDAIAAIVPTWPENATASGGAPVFCRPPSAISVPMASRV